MNLLGGFKLKGMILQDEPLSKHTTFRIGGPVKVWAVAEGLDELTDLFEISKNEGLRILLIGQGSNLLISDRPLNRIAVSLGGAFTLFRITPNRVSCGAGCGLQKFILETLEGGYAGLEFMAGIPGSVGGAIRMNAGSGLNGPWISEFIECLKVIDFGGRIEYLSKRDLRFGYRRSNLNNCVIIEAEFNLKKIKDKIGLLNEYKKFLDEKKKRQEISLPSAGCVFRNPMDSKLSAGQLIEGCGLKGKRVGDAMVSMKHANFIVNLGKATFKDVMNLIDLIKDTVFKKYRVLLDTEIEILT